MLFRVMQSCTNKVNIMHTWQSLLNKEKVSQDLEDDFPTCLLLTRYLYLETTYIIQGYSTEDPRPKGAVTPPPYSPPPPLLWSSLQTVFLPAIPGLN